MSVDTWEKLVNLPNADFEILIEFNPAVNPDAYTWVKTGGYTYVYEAVVSFADSTPPISAVVENGTSLTLKNNVGEVEANAGYYYDASVDKVYVHCVDGGDPGSTTKTMMIYVWIDNATRTRVFNSRQYRPTVKLDSLPLLALSVDDIVEGIYKFNFGSFTLTNDGWWDKASCRYIWKGCRVIIRIGGEELSYIEYKTSFVGRVSDYFVADIAASFSVKDIRVGTFAQLPINKYWKTTYSNMADGDEGKSIPIAYGVCTKCIPTCIDPTAGTGGRWKFADGEVYEITNARKNGVTLSFPSQYTKDPTLGEITLLCGFDAVSGDTLEVDIKGFKSLGGSYIVKGASIALNMLKRFLRFVDEELDLDSFAATDALRTNELAIYVDTEQSSREILQTIGRSIMAFFTPTQDGKLAFKAYTTDVPLGTLKLRDEDYKSWKVTFDDSFVRQTVKVKYGKDSKEQDFKIVVETNDAVKYKYDTQEDLSVVTYLRLQADAASLALGLKNLVSRPITTVETDFGAKGFPKSPTDKVLITRLRAADLQGKFTNKVFRIKSIEKDFARQKTKIVAMDDLQTLGEGYCSNCYACQLCFSQEQGCSVCYVCQICVNSQGSQCYLCYACEACDACFACYACQLCDYGEATCTMCMKCVACEVCDSVQEGCTGCDVCVDCMDCVSSECGVGYY